MPAQINPSVTNPTIATIYQEIDEGRLILQPDFQRKFVWTSEHQESFIDTILKGLPFPEIYVCEGEVNLQKLRTTKVVIDGQQRLTTIKNYIEGKSIQPFKNVITYQSLSDLEKRAFLTYKLVERNLGKIDEETIREIFKRINLTKFKLEDIEIHNAIYDGHFIQAARFILENISLEKYDVFRESEYTRMADLHFILSVMATLESGGYFGQDSEVETKIATFNNQYPNKDFMTARLIKTFAIIKDLNLPLDSMWFRKSNFFTLVVEVARNIEILPDDFSDKILKFEESVMASKSNTATEFYRYYTYMYQGTQNRKARVTRAEFFAKYCL